MITSKTLNLLSIDQENMSAQINSLQNHSSILISKDAIALRVAELKTLSVNAYTEQVLQPVEFSNRYLPEQVIQEIADEIDGLEQDGPLILADIKVAGLQLAVVAQSRSSQNGSFQPEHHRRAALFITDADRLAKADAVLTFIDTPGADAGAQANQNLQAHSISALIAAFTQLPIPSLAIVWGKAYSGGAIPLAATQRLLIVKDGLFNTIQPQGLAAIARRQSLSWQKCAQLVGLSAHELASDGVVDGVIDLSPNDVTPNDLQQLKALLREQFAEISVEVAAFKMLRRVDDYAQACREQRLQQIKLRIDFSESGQGTAVGEDVPQILPVELVEQDSFAQWMSSTHLIQYELQLKSCWSDFITLNKTAGHGAYQIKLDSMAFELAAYLSQQWQTDFSRNMLKLGLHRPSDLPLEQCRGVEQVIALAVLQAALQQQAKNIQLIHAVYAQLLMHAAAIAQEYSKSNSREISPQTLQQLVQAAVQQVEGADFSLFLQWIAELNHKGRLQELIGATNQWMQKANPRMEDVLLINMGFVVTSLLPRLHAHLSVGEDFDGSFSPNIIGRTKNFWYRLTCTSRNVRLQAVLEQHKSALKIPVSWFQNQLFTSFTPLYEKLESKNLKNFPGFAQSILKTHEQGLKASGLVTAEASLVCDDQDRRLGVFISNSVFQAGAFDMSSAEKLCRLLDDCADKKRPVIGFISSGGMQTKEGAAALFSMAIVNEAINEFNRRMPGSIMIIGFGDCTGGAQASLVTHPAVNSAYFSGTNMPFAGQVVVPQHLPLQSTLSNYMSRTQGAMQSLIQHPLLTGLDAELAAIDPHFPKAEIDLRSALEQWLGGVESSSADISGAHSPETLKKKYFDIEKVLIHARGCTAARLIEAAHQLNKRVLLVQSDPDMHSGLLNYLHEEDQVVCLGGSTPDESYLNADSILRIAELYSVDAIHPGIGFLSENADFAYQCNQRGFNFIGPDAASIELMGDKAQAISTAAAVGLPTVPGSCGAVADVVVAIQIAAKIGYPLLVKSSFGGGGKGIAVVRNDAELRNNFQILSREAKSAFGNGELYLERYLEAVRHIEVQVLRDSLGHCEVLGIRDCSVQRNRQKIIEESGEYVLVQSQITQLKSWSRLLSEHIDYIGAGTVEFLYDLAKNEFYFMEMNTRLQVEHPVTEFTTGMDIVAQQFAVAEGKPVQRLIQPVGGHAIELRINAEKVELGESLRVMPSTGRLTRFDVPPKPWARLLSFSASGCEVTPFYDSLVAQLIVHGENREQAIQRMLELLSECDIRGIDTNISLLKLVLEDEVFVGGDYSTAYLEQLLERKNISDQGSNEEGDAVPAAQCFELHGDEIYLKSPSSGVVYLSPSPSEANYIECGQLVDADSSLLLLEVMKVFMPLKLSSFMSVEHFERYQVQHIRIQDEDYVQEGEVLLILKKLS